MHQRVQDKTYLCYAGFNQWTLISFRSTCHLPIENWMKKYHRCDQDSIGIRNGRRWRKYKLSVEYNRWKICQESGGFSTLIVSAVKNEWIIFLKINPKVWNAHDNGGGGDENEVFMFPTNCEKTNGMFKWEESYLDTLPLLTSRNSSQAVCLIMSLDEKISYFMNLTRLLGFAHHPRRAFADF